MDARDRVTTMADNIPSGGSGSDAMDRLRVAIENHQKATERQTATTRWLNVVMTRSDDLDGSPHRRPDLAHRPLLAFLVVARATSGVADARADRGCAGSREGVGSQAAQRQRPPSSSASRFTPAQRGFWRFTLCCLAFQSGRSDDAMLAARS
jgi:hypothetical protein